MRSCAHTNPPCPAAPWQALYGKAQPGGQHFAPKLQQHGQGRGVKHAQRGGVTTRALPGAAPPPTAAAAPDRPWPGGGVSSEGKTQCGGGRGRHGLWNEEKLRANGQPLAAFDLLRATSVSIRPSMPLALISCANWLR